MIKISIELKNSIRQPEGNYYQVKGKVDDRGKVKIEKKKWPATDDTHQGEYKEKLEYNTTPENVNAFIQCIDRQALSEEMGKGHGAVQWQVNINENNLKTKYRGFVEGTESFTKIAQCFNDIFQLPQKFEL